MSTTVIRKKERAYRPFTKEELETIKECNKKITLIDLSVKLGMNYTNLSSALKYHRVAFNPFITSKILPKKDDPKMVKEKNSEGESILTDEIMKSWLFG